MIYHSTLMAGVRKILAQAEMDILKLTREGVVEEGGQFPQMAPTVRPGPPAFEFGKASIERLNKVIPTLAAVVEAAIKMSSQDFTVLCGARTISDQTIAFKAGNSKTMHSMHLIQADGFSHAVDLVPWVDGKPVWDWKRIYPIVVAMKIAAQQLHFADRIRWGGAWDRRLADLAAGEERQESEAYANRHPGADFLDGPHFEWVS